MKRLLPYIFLQLTLASLMGCAAMHSAERNEPYTSYQVTLVVSGTDTRDLHELLANVPRVNITGFSHLANVNVLNPGFQQYEFRVHDAGALQALKTALQNAGVPVANLQVKEATL